MISTERTRVKIKEVVSSQLPSFVRDTYPLLNDFLKEYYSSQEYSGSPLDLLQNIDQYFDLESLTNYTKTCVLDGSITDYDTTISVVYNPSENLLGTYGFPDRYGLLKIDDEIILYKSKTNTTFEECVRGFSGITKYQSGNNPQQLIFSETDSKSHEDESIIENLSVLFLDEFLKKLKNQFLPGFEDRDIASSVNQKTLISRISDFYDSKGTEESIRILFGALYGEKVKVINPKDFLIKPSGAFYRKTKDLIVEAVEGNPLGLSSSTLFQDSIPEYGIRYSEAPIANVELVKTKNKNYYRIQLDYDYDMKDNTAYGGLSAPFTVHPYTKSTTQVSSGSTVLDVDSTVGFPTSGNLFVSLSTGEIETLSYTSKSLTQFFGVEPASATVSIGSTVRLATNAYGYIGVSTSNIVKVRIGSVLNGITPLDDGFYFSNNDSARLSQLGIANTTSKANDWILNIPVKYDIQELTLIDSANFAYRIKTIDATIFKVGDTFSLEDESGVTYEGSISSITNKNTFTIRVNRTIAPSSFYTIERKIKKSIVSSSLTRSSYINNYNSDVQNIYSNFSGDILVASPSIPSYKDQPLSFYDKVIPLNGSFSGDTLTVSNVSDHGYYTGDIVHYKPGLLPIDVNGDGITDIESESRFTNFGEGNYFVKRVNQNQLKLSRSRSDIFNNNFLNIAGIVTSNIIEPSLFKNNSVKTQNLLRLLQEPSNESGIYDTPSDENIGIFINGVELTNYKSSDFVRFGEIEDVVVSQSGRNYDVINPPILRIYDSVGVGTGAIGIVCVKGNLERIDVIDTGFDYISDPVIDIVGGNGFGAEAKANTSLIVHSVSFVPTEASAFVSTTSNTIGFSTFHKFRGVESVIYKTDGESGILGLNTNSTYYAKSIDSYTVRLFKSENDAVLGINTVTLSGYGSGIHRLESTEPKKVVTSVSIVNSGENYENKERTCGVSGINTSLGQINIPNHGYQSREVITYSSTGSSISGLSTSLKYIVTKIDEDNFKLSTVGIASTNKYFYYETKQHVDITSIGSGTHIFNYEPISVTISGTIGVSTSAGQNFDAVLQPVFRGDIHSVNLRDGGVGYGASEILNYDRQPNYEFFSGKDAELIPIVNNGSITEVIVNYGGEQYNSPPTLKINGNGNYAVLTPIINNGSITSVKVISGGTGYDSNTTISVLSSGVGANLSFKIKQWNVNLFEKSLNILSPDDGIIRKAKNNRYELQYCHVYTPRKLRETVYQKTQDNEVKYGVFDLQKVNNQESTSQYHSPIIGWAYDGNPIYGPYGFTSKTGGITRLMSSSYKLNVSTLNRPPFPNGFFIEDYIFDNSGDLDEHNGRYCVTPEYPNGTYAYFTTIDGNSIESVAPFIGYRKPTFPYVIGNSFKSKPIDFNFDRLSNQDDYDITLNNNETNYPGPWLRNTTQYLLQSNSSYYDYFYDPLKDNTYTATIKSASEGQVESISIIESGSNYKVGDKLVFDNSGTNGKSASAFVSEIKGKEVNSISVASTIIYNAEISPLNADGIYVVYSDSPHGLLNSDVVNITGISTFSSYLQGSYNIGIVTEKYSLATAVGTTAITGIVTFIPLLGNLNKTTIRENDILQIDSEKMKVLNVDLSASRVRVLRASEGTTGAAHTANSQVAEVSRKFTFISSPESRVIFERNREIYFNPGESVGLGTISGVGIGSTIVFSNIGVGISQIFIPTRSIYLPQHNLITGEPLTYSSNGGTPIVVSNGSTTYSLQDSSTVYAASISENLLGISSVKIGIGTTGTFVGVGSTNINQQLLHFVGFGNGVYHSFTTNKLNAVKSQITKNTVTVSTASTHNLSIADSINVEVKPSIASTIVVKYNDYNRRVVINPRSFSASDVSVENNTISVLNHNLKTGDPIIHTSNSPSGGLVNQKIYYVINHTKDLIKLSTSKYGTELFEKDIVNITSASSGTISPINPKIDVYRNSRIVFDLSDSSLSSLSASTLYSAFEFKLYFDEEFTQEFLGKLSGTSFNVSNIGQVGVSSNASFNLTINDNVPTKLFYKLSPTNLNFIAQTKKEIVIDKDVSDSNLLNIVSSKYNGMYSVSGIASTSFNYYLKDVPESSEYTSSQASIVYTTSSSQSSGGISSVKINYGGYGYRQIPGISTITTDNGINGKLEAFSSGIGTVLTISSDLIGYDFPTDKTLRPSCNLPEVFKVLPFDKIGFIGVTSAGNGYSLAPDLIVIDQTTNKVVNDIDLKYTLGKTSVDILKQTEGINGQPKIISINNSNGVRIKSLTFNALTKDVSVGLNTGFSDIFPFSVGDKVLIENVSVGVGTTGTGYNSENYDYQLFTLTNVPAGNTGLGGNVGIVTFNMSNVLQNGEFPGNYDSVRSFGRIIPEKDFPIFDIQLKKTPFAKGEIVTSGNKVGKVESWNDKVNILKLSSSKEFVPGDVIRGLGTKTKGVVGQKYDFNSYANTAATSEVVSGWIDDVGFLNNNLQRIQNNEYYQNFSYTLKSKVTFDDWDNVVSSLAHNSGFVKFSDLQVESSSNSKVIVRTPNEGSTVDVLNDFISTIDLSCYPDYDAVSENRLTISNRVISSEIYFSERILTDYFESVGNRVLTIDDISDQFNSDPRPTPYSIIDRFDISEKVKKYFTYIRDKRYTDERQALIVDVVHNGSRSYINQYGRVESIYDMGSFDITFSGSYGYLLFYPTLYEVNDFDISYLSFDIYNSVSGIGSTTLGDTVEIKSQQVSVPAATVGTVVSIATSYRASKIIVQINSSDGRQEIDELNLIHDGTNVELVEYGQMTTSNIDSYEPTGLGTYSAYISGSNLNIDFTPISGIGVTVDTIQVSIANTASTGISTVEFGFDDQTIADISSTITAIASSTSPTQNVIAKYFNDETSDNEHDAAYFVVCVEDITNGRYEISEAILIDAGSQTYLTEYGNVRTGAGIGTIGAGAGTTFTSLYYTPNPNIDVQVRVFQASLQLVSASSITPEIELNLNDAKITVGFGNYTGTFTDVKREFGLSHGGRNIFQRDFLGAESTVVDVTSNTIAIPEHFFVTGEKLTYTHAGVDNTQAIGIASTDFGVGIGTTDKLPSTVYAIKVDERRIRLARSAEDALLSTPVALDITNVGIGTSHTLTANNQNGRCLIAIDNLIQSPLVSTAITTGLSTNVSRTDNILVFSGITSFFGGDLIKVDDEIMKIRSVGFGSTNQILVQRPWMGTGLATHAVYSQVTKIKGDYNIVNNNIHFIDAPKGPIPIGSSTNAPDERDWTGITTHSKFQGRTFLRTGIPNSTEHTYSRNYIFDDISEQFDASTKTFTLKVDKQNIAGFSTNNSIILVKRIFQNPQGTLTQTQDYSLSESSGITSITFLGAATSTSSDPNSATIPVGGIIVSVGSTGGFGYQPLVAAGGTAIVSAAGTISSISIGNSGSGYRSGIQTVVNVGVYTASTGTPNIQFIGTAAISNGNIVSVAVTNPGIGYTRSNPPKVIFDSPLSYSNIPLVYSSSSASGLGTEATVDIVVGQGSSVIDFEISNFGYRYGNGQILTVQSGGLSGIPTDLSKPFSEFQIRIEKVETNEFSGWNVGELEILDKIESKFDGVRRRFTISKNDSPVTIKAKSGSNIDVQATLLVFLNNVLQVPGEGYTFTGGSVITFAEPPKPQVNGITGTGDKCTILFYKGSGDIDVSFNDVIETIKVGDTVTIQDSQSLCSGSIRQDERLIVDVISSDTIETNPYLGQGITDDINCIRPITWCQQRSDRLVNGKIVGKGRVLYEPLINPTANIIQNVGSSSTVIFVDNVKTFFDSVAENQTTENKNRILILSRNELVSAAATAIVSIAGTISSVAITTGGSGYNSTPEVSIANPVGLGTTQRASAIASISSGIVTSIAVSYGGTQTGTAYTSSNPPVVLIEPPSPTYEINNVTSYTGDFGIIVGVSTTSVGVASTGIVFDLHIPINSYLRSSSVMGGAGITTISGIQTGYYFVAYNTNVGNAKTSLNSDGSILGIGTEFLDNVYRVAAVSIAQTSIPGIGVTFISRVTVSVTDNQISGVAHTNFYGEYSWGRILLGNRINAQSFDSYTRNGVAGLTTSASVTRVIPLKYQNYL